MILIMVENDTMASMPASILVGTDRPEFIQSETLIDMFDHAVSLHADRIAIRSSHANFTYSQLSKASQIIATRLLEIGVKPGDRVGLWCARGPLIPAAMIAIMRVGAAYVPFDSHTPVARVEAGCLDAGINVLVHDASTAPHAISMPFQHLLIDVSVFSAHSPIANSSLGKLINAAAPNSLAYISFTSGSSGRPKGVMVAHSQVCHWIRSNLSITGILQSDIVYQGASAAFDTCIEEIWSTLLVGAELIIADEMVARDPHEIVHLLNRHRVTIMHTVPSLAALMEPSIPSLRLLNLGGEAVNPTLVERWARPDLRIINTYGPTEGTVSCTLAELSPGQAITIGRPLPNYRIYIVDDEGEPVPLGQIGEIWIGGPSVTNGYVGRPDLTAERFSIDPFVERNDGSQRIYRTGDNARIGDNGEIIFLGRRDGQVKIRGYRVELEEIETVLTELACVQWAAIVPQIHDNGDISLIAYLVATADQELRLDDIRRHLKQRVAPYMMPHRFRKIDDLPRLASGKIDRQGLALEAVGEPLTHHKESAELSLLEQRLADALKPFIGQEMISPTADFFDDLGAHSLLMARFVSQLRRSADLARLSMRDVYVARNLRALANLLEPRLQVALASANEHPKENIIAQKPSLIDRRRYLFCAIGQGVSLLILYGLLAAVLVTPYFAYALADEWYDDTTTSFGLCILTAMELSIALFYLSIIAKWTLIGRYKAGDYPLWGSYYFRCWLVETILQLSPLQFLSNSPLYNHALRLLGVKIGNHVNLGGLDIGAFDLVEIRDGASFGSSVLINNRIFEGNFMRLRPVLCGRDVHIGSVVTLNGGCTIGDGAEIKDMSQIAGHDIIEPCDIWSGSPARKIGSVEPYMSASKASPLINRFLFTLLYIVLANCLVICSIFPILPILYILNTLDAASADWDFTYLFLTPIFGFIYTILFAAIVIAARWIVLGRVKAGTYDVQSLFFARKWFVDKLFDLSLTVLRSFFSTIYVIPYYRLLGAKIGERAEISTASNVTHDLLDIGTEAFVADGVMLGDAQIRRGKLILRRTTLGYRCFAGNASVIPDGSMMPDETLLGVLSLAPNGNDPQLTRGTTWLGIPSQSLPNREMFIDYPESLTFRPSGLRWLGRLAIETLRIVFPSGYLMASLTLLATAAFEMEDRFGLFWSIISLPFFYLLLVALPALVIVAALKWILIGRYRKGTHPMWTAFVWTSEAITAVYEMLLIPLLFEFLRGTPFMAWPLRLLGVKIGRRTLIDTTDITEFDLVKIGDGAILGYQAGLQTHLFEDRVMKLGPVIIGAGANIGERSILLYDTMIGEQCLIAPQSLVMKGEELPAGSRWTGSPAEPL